MPTVAVVDGVKIELYFDEHPPPHFHVKIAGYRAQVSIDALSVIRGELPRPYFRKVVRWAQTRRAPLLRAWEACRIKQDPERIE